MPNGSTHIRLGAVTGGAGALYHARNEAPRDMAIEVLGGVLGGAIGGLLPDRLDPPFSPRHRGMFHSLLALLVVIVVVLDAEREACRARGRQGHKVGPGRRRSTIECDLWKLAAGAIAGLQWGYTSHLMADLTTPASLPLMCRGF